MQYRNEAMSEGVSQSVLKFKKSGAEIQRAIDGRIGDLDNESNSLRSKVAHICKDREIDAEEVLRAETEEAVNTYSSKAMSNAPRGNAMLQALQQDLNDLRLFTGEIRHNETRKMSLARIKKNIEPERSFDLGVLELAQFGF